MSYRRRAVCAAARNFYDNALHDTIRGLACLRANRPKTSAACNRVLVSHGQWRSVFRHHHLHRHAGLAFLGTAHLKHTGLASTQSEADERARGRKFLQGRNNGDTIAAKDGPIAFEQIELGVLDLVGRRDSYQRVGRCQIMPE